MTMDPVTDATDINRQFAEAVRAVLLPWSEQVSEALREVARVLACEGILWRDIPPAYRKHGGRRRSRREMRDIRGRRKYGDSAGRDARARSEYGDHHQ